MSWYTCLKTPGWWLKSARRALASMHELEANVHVMNISSQRRRIWCVTEPGLYKLIARSSTPEAQAPVATPTHAHVPSDGSRTPGTPRSSTAHLGLKTPGNDARLQHTLLQPLPSSPRQEAAKPHASDPHACMHIACHNTSISRYNGCVCGHVRCARAAYVLGAAVCRTCGCAHAPPAPCPWAVRHVGRGVWGS